MGNPKENYLSVGETPEERESRLLAEEKRRENRYKKLQLWFNGSLMVASVLTLGTVAYQNRVLRESLHETRRQSEAAENTATAAFDAVAVARENFNKSQRPYVWLSRTDGPKHIEAGGGRVLWNLHFTNFGQSPARIIGIDARMNIGENALGLARPLQTDRTASLPPLLPGKDDFTSVVSEQVVARPQFGDLLQLNASVVVYGRVVYSDASGVRYETDFCMHNLQSGAKAYCAENGANSIR